MTDIATIGLTQNKVAIIDSEDFDKINLFRWCAVSALNNRWYAKTNSGIGIVYMHQLILGIENDLSIDHANGNGLDNRKSNLRFANKSQQAANKIKSKSSYRTSDYKGVRWSGSSWMSRITFNGTCIYLGRFQDEKDAAKKYDEAAKELFGEFARTNF